MTEPLPALSCAAREKSLLCFTFRFESIFERMRIWGRQFLVCGGPDGKHGQQGIRGGRLLTIFEPEEGEASSRKGQTPDTISPFFLSSGEGSSKNIGCMRHLPNHIW